jgi:beta-lactamase regulating signal transducer with metallopeptidase domain/predicted  nucleic acid-binding Zn-ribbon protein
MDALVLLLKASLILLLSLAAAPLLARSPAVTRHQIWTLTFGALLALPLLGLALPVLNVPVPERLSVLASLRGPIESDAAFGAPVGAKTAGAAVAPDLAQTGLASNAGRSTPSSVGGRSNAPAPAGSALRLLPLAWFLGTVAAVAALLLSLLRVALLARASDVVTDPSWQEAAQKFGDRLGLRRPARLVTSPRVATPMAGGLWRPVIFLPASAGEWSADWRDVVLAHELAHLARRDPIRHVLARLAVGLYWFHPLAWLAARQATAARELACDEAVLALGTRPSTYARVLLGLADSMRPTGAAVAALPMVERSLLEKRLMTMLHDKALPAMRRRFWIPAIGTALFTLAIAVAQPIARPADYGGPAPGLDLPPASPAAPVMAAAPLMAGAQAAVRRDTSACDWSGSGSFRGTISSGTGKRIGTSGEVHVIQQTLGDLRVCMLAEDVGEFSNAPPSLWLTNASRTVIEARRGATVQRLEATRQAGEPQFSWQSGGIERPFDGAAQQWRDRMLETLDTLWEISSIRGEQSSLGGEISSIRGEESSLRGEISSLRGHLSSMRGDVSSIRGEESSLRGEISAIRGHVSSLRGEISSARGAISSLNADRLQGAGAPSARLIADLEAQIALLEREIRDFDADAKVAELEQEIQRFDADRKVAAVEAEIRAFDVEAKVAEIERILAGLDVNGRIEAIERDIVALDAGGRMLELQQQLDAEMKRLEAALSAIR